MKNGPNAVRSSSSSDVRVITVIIHFAVACTYTGFLRIYSLTSVLYYNNPNTLNIPSAGRTVYSKELVLCGVLRQSLDLSEHILASPMTSLTEGKRKRGGDGGSSGAAKRSKR